MKSLTLKMFAMVLAVILVASVLVLLCQDTEAQSATHAQYTCVFRFTQGNVPAPECRLYVVVDGGTEGEAAINAHKFLQDRLTIDACAKLQFLEAQRKR